MGPSAVNGTAHDATVFSSTITTNAQIISCIFSMNAVHIACGVQPVFVCMTDSH